MSVGATTCHTHTNKTLLQRDPSHTAVLLSCLALLQIDSEEGGREGQGELSREWGDLKRETYTITDNLENAISHIHN